MLSDKNCSHFEFYFLPEKPHFEDNCLWIYISVLYWYSWMNILMPAKFIRNPGKRSRKITVFPKVFQIHCLYLERFAGICFFRTWFTGLGCFEFFGGDWVLIWELKEEFREFSSSIKLKPSSLGLLPANHIVPVSFEHYQRDNMKKQIFLRTVRKEVVLEE